MNRTATTGSALGALFFLSVLVRAIFPGLAVPPAASLSPPGQAAPSKTAKPDQDADGPWKASQGFFAGQGSDCPAAGPTSNPRLQKWCIPTGADVHALIAIAPDPVRSHMALTFDRTVEGIQLAAQKWDYVMDRYWLPWRVPSKSEESAAASAQAATTEARAGEPGLLLFRRSTVPKPSVLFVFLVADTSTAGIDGTQFSKAVDYIDVVSSASAQNEPVRVVGPSFSGSLASLRRLTDARTSRKFFVSSGSVSSLCAMAEQGLLAKWPSEGCGKEPDHYATDVKSSNVTFRSFVHDTPSAVRLLVGTFYRDPATQCTRPQVAILSETGTTFGVNVQQTGRCITSFVFPREIANLRNASHPAAAPTQASQEIPSARSPFLSLDLADRTNSSDAPPDYSLQGPPSKEAVLMNIAAGFRRAQFRYIGIIGSNVLDILFLTDFLREVCPDSRLFMVNGDLLFERQFDNVPYVGMLAATTFTLADRTLEPSGSTWRDAPHMPFSDEYEQGTYEAVHGTIGDLLHLAPDPEASASFAQPPLWMMVVGVGGYWPVRLLDATPALTATPTLGPTHFTGTWQLLVILLITVALFQIAVLLTASPFAPQFRDFAPVTAAPVQRLFLIQVACATLALGLTLLLMPAWRYAPSPFFLEGIGTLVLGAVCAAALLIVANSCLRCRWKQRVDPAASDATDRTLRSQLLVFAVVWIVTAVAAYEWWQLLGRDPASLYGFFFAYRVINPTSGVSPITPMIPLLAAAYAWTFFEIWRLRFNDTLRPRLFRGGCQGDGRPRPGLASETRIADAIQGYWLKGSYVVFFVVAFVVWLTSFHPSNPFVLFEAGGFGVLFGVLFCLVVALMLSAGCRVAQVWSALRGLLGELERSRVRLTFERLKDRSWSFWRQGGEDAEWAYMARSLEAVNRLGTGDAPALPLPPDDDGLERICASKAKLDLALRSQPRTDATRDFEALATEIENVKTSLVGADPRPFLQSAVDAATQSLAVCRAVDARRPAVLEEARKNFSRRVADLLDTIAISTASSTVQDDVREVRREILQLRAKAPRFAAARSFLEYLGGLRRSATRGTSESQAGISGIDQAHTLEAAIRRLQESLADALCGTLAGLESRWSMETRMLSDVESVETADGKSAPAPEMRQQQCLEEFVALRYVAFIRGALSHLRHAMIFLALSFSMVLISLNIYSFEPHRSLIWSFTAIFVLIGVMVVGVLMQLHRDPIMSRITNTTGNSLDMHFYLRIVAFGAVPLLTLLATNFPSIGRYLVSFVGPSLEALK